VRTASSMNAEPPWDSRGVANLLLDIIEQRGRQATHIDLQKLLYFAHGRFLVGSGVPLVSGYFEAWRRGPVHPTVYDAFKEAGARPIAFRAERTNLVTGQRSIVPAPDSPLVREHLDLVAIFYGRFTTGHLIEISHATGAPWDLTVKRTNSLITLGMRIPDDVIKFAFRRHKVAVGSTSPPGDELEDTPYT
jgi:uncharacterized phage-associated protein